MSYQVLARKWRPQRFDDVVGQQAVTRTLRNALTSGRIGQAYVFAGSRGCGKTTTARILARALNCQNGPTADPCGECDACIEIAQGRDLDVLEIDAASNTSVENIREVVIAGLSIAPARNRYKVFIIDEVHQLSSSSFNALLKSVEEPPAHVVFMMATTELHKIPDTILSRSQVFEFKSISTRAITTQLRMIAGAEGLTIDDAALTLVARAGEGSMRDAQSALDQVMAFAGTTITSDDVAMVLGLVGRDLLFDMLDAVVAEDASRAFALADRAVEAGHDLKLVCRELSHVVRDVMVLSIDPARAGDGELAEGERERLLEIGSRFSREDLMRSFDLLARAEQDIRNAAHPRYQFEMVLLRWMHLRKLVPLTELLDQMGAGALPARSATTSAPRPQAFAASRPAPRPVSSASAPAPVPVPSRPAPAPRGAAPAEEFAIPAGRPSAPAAKRAAAPAVTPATPAAVPAATAPPAAAASPAASPAATAAAATKESGGFKDALLAEIRGTKAFFYNTVVAQAQKIEVRAAATGHEVTFTFSPNHRALREQFEQSRAWLEQTAERLAGQRVLVSAVQGVAPSSEAAPAAAPEKPAPGGRDLKSEAMTSSAVQAMLDVFPAEIRDVEEM